MLFVKLLGLPATRCNHTVCLFWIVLNQERNIRKADLLNMGVACVMITVKDLTKKQQLYIVSCVFIVSYWHVLSYKSRYLYYQKCKCYINCQQAD